MSEGLISFRQQRGGKEREGGGGGVHRVVGQEKKIADGNGAGTQPRRNLVHSGLQVLGTIFFGRIFVLVPHDRLASLEFSKLFVSLKVSEISSLGSLLIGLIINRPADT